MSLRTFPMVRALSAISVALLLAACASTQPQTSDAIAPEPVGTVTLQRAQMIPTALQMLDIGIQVFDTRTAPETINLPGAAIFAEIRNTETHYLPVALRHVLSESNQWGVIRVLPQADPSVDLQISGQILHSDGSRLVLHIEAVDSAGRKWIDKTYADIARTADYPDIVPSLRDNPALFDAQDPFADLYAAIANDLLSVRESLGDQELHRIRDVAQLHYASDLSPEAFSTYLISDADGLLSLNRLPAHNDPMLSHVEDIRARHHVFIDTIDEYYEALYQDVRPLYTIWRQYSFEQVVEEQESLQRGFNNQRGTGSFESISQNYNRYKWSKIFEQEFVALASGFVSETAPAVLELSRNVSGLTGPVEEQYAQWRVYLRGLFDIQSEGLMLGPES
jgi:hypothetical protein